MSVGSAIQGDSLADVLERVLDSGIVVAGDVTVSLVGIELLTIKVRLLVASVDKAKELGINWWEHDPMLTASGTEGRIEALTRENDLLRERLGAIEARLAAADG